jgi:outer membrane protein assembly factor BamE (lipoprotein component of BamABCDE complex)
MRAMRRSSVRALVLAVALALGACATAPVEPAAIEHIARGMSADEVRMTLGPPHEIGGVTEFGGEAWFYRSGVSGSPHRITFDALGVVEQIVVVRQSR